jgi:hypothetical protein
MHRKRYITAAIAVATVIAALTGLALAQSNQRRGGWGSVVPHSYNKLAPTESNSATLATRAQDTCGASVQEGYNIYSALVGTWVDTVTVTSASGTSQFTELATFNLGGTMTEQGEANGNTQSSGRGVWVGSRHGLTATFEDFPYDGTGNPTGLLRIRGSYQLDQNGDLVAPKVTVDFIDSDGNVICGVATATITGTRIRALTP